MRSGGSHTTRPWYLGPWVHIIWSVFVRHAKDYFAQLASYLYEHVKYSNMWFFLCSYVSSRWLLPLTPTQRRSVLSRAKSAEQTRRVSRSRNGSFNSHHLQCGKESWTSVTSELWGTTFSSSFCCAILNRTSWPHAEKWIVCYSLYFLASSTVPASRLPRPISLAVCLSFWFLAFLKKKFQHSRIV